MMSIVSELFFPTFLMLLLCVSFVRKKDTIASFTKGAKSGFSAICSIAPNILAVMVASSVFRESGAMTFFLRYFTPLLKLIRIPQGIAELILLRPISGSGAMVLLTQVYEQFGADSYEGLLASIICASTETTLYTVMVYFGVTGVKKTKLPLIIGLITDGIVIFLAVAFVNLFFSVA